jgi:cytochrome c peroxidase
VQHASRVVAGAVALVVAFQSAPTQSSPPARPQLPPAVPKDELRDEMLTGDSLLGLGERIPGVENTPLALARLRLGRRLFFDPVLSSDRSVSCASCHQPDHAFATNDVKPPGVGGHACARNAPTLFNRALGTLQFFDGRAGSLEAQALMPIENQDEMGTTVDEAVRRLAQLPEYRELFEAAGTAEPNREALAASLAEFVRRLVAGDSPIDRFRAAQGDLTTTERQGLWLFESRGRCWRCHAGPNFSDESFHNTGVGAKEGRPEPGRAAITHDDADQGRFKTPTLRMVAETAPYMHDGSLATLNDVLEFYKRGGNANDHRDALLQPVELSNDDVAALIALLHALSRRAEGERER